MHEVSRPFWYEPARGYKRVGAGSQLDGWTSDHSVPPLPALVRLAEQAVTAITGVSPTARIIAHKAPSNLVTSAARTLQDARSAVTERCSVTQGAHADRQPAH